MVKRLFFFPPSLEEVSFFYILSLSVFLFPLPKPPLFIVYEKKEVEST